jgi:uncharacterized protein YjbI with pentapeptide repeats
MVARLVQALWSLGNKNELMSCKACVVDVCSAQFSSVQFSSVQFSSVQFSSVQFSSVQFNAGDKLGFFERFASLSSF